MWGSWCFPLSCLRSGPIVFEVWVSGCSLPLIFPYWNSLDSYPRILMSMETWCGALLGHLWGGTTRVPMFCSPSFEGPARLSYVCAAARLPTHLTISLFYNSATYLLLLWRIHWGHWTAASGCSLIKVCLHSMHPEYWQNSLKFFHSTHTILVGIHFLSISPKPTEDINNSPIPCSQALSLASCPPQW